MKLLCTGDLHINAWIPFSTLDEFGRPSRLLDYLKLSETLAKLALDKGCDAIILAGDISEASLQRPMVHDIIGDFLRTLSKDLPVYVIHGQHDSSSKEGRSMGKNSILIEICKDLQNVHYYPDPTLTKIGTHSVYLQSWTDGHELDGPSADIFVGHGIVTGCSNLDGFIFMNGFDRDELLEKYRLSIIGDIHKRQVHTSGDSEERVVLQPGTPIQNSWRDQEDCGVYTAEISGLTDPVELEFFSIHDLIPDTFHRFTYDSPIETDLIHSRPKVGVKKKDKNIQKSLEIKRDNTVIYETCRGLLEEDSDATNKELITQYLEEVFERTALASDKMIAKSRITSMQAKNFLSITEASLDLEAFPKSCVSVGQNGCVDGDTEFLSDFGWKKISDYQEGDLISEYNLEDDTISLTHPEAYIKAPCTEFYKINPPRGVDMVLSPEHNVLYWPTRAASSRPRFLSCEEVVQRHLKSKTSGWAGSIKTTFKSTRPGLDITEGELRLQVAVMADGRVVKEGKNNYTEMRFSKERKYLRLLALCKKYNLPHDDKGEKYSAQYSNNKEFQVIVWPKWKDKTFDDKYWTCSQEQLEIIADECWRWDGSDLRTSYTYYTSDEVNVDFIQYCFSCSGYNTCIYPYAKKSLTSGGLQRRVEWKVQASTAGGGFRGIANKDRKLKIDKISSEDGYKYCFTTSTGAFLARRSNRVFLTGNSGKTTIPEAIYWCLTGSNTKGVPISEIINNRNGAEHCEVEVQIEINSQDFTIKRERKMNSSSLTIFDQDNNSIKFGSIRETQAEIYKLLGLQEWQIYMFSYFSAEKTNLFANLTEGSKNDLIGQIVGLDFVESMRLYAKEQKSQKRTETLRLEGVISEKDSSINNYTRKLKRLQEENSQDSSGTKAQIQKLTNSLRVIEEQQDSETKTLIGEFGEGILELDSSNSEVSQEYYKVQSLLETSETKRVMIETSLNSDKKKLKEALGGQCPLCKQDIHDLSFISDLKTSIKDNLNRAKELPDVEELKNTLTALSSELQEWTQKNKALKRVLSSRDSLERKKTGIYREISELETTSALEEKDQSLIEEAQKDLAQAGVELEQAQKELSGLSRISKAWAYLETKMFKKNGDLTKELNKQGSELIQACIDEVLFGLDASIKISKDLSLRGTFNFEHKVQYSGMSSGQRRLTDIVMMVSLNNLFSKIYNLEDGVLGLTVYDEVLSFLDDKYIEIAKQIVDQSISRKILVITHDSNLMNMYDSRIKAKITKTGSEYTKSWE